MPNKLILFPLIAMVALTILVAVVMLKRRIATFKAKRIHPQKVALSAQMSALVEDSRASDNFRNLFEMPVLFYAAALTIFAAGLTSMPLVVMAWGFVGARYAHSFIHCTSNHVMRRFYAFATSVTLLMLIWIWIAFQLLSVS